MEAAEEGKEGKLVSISMIKSISLSERWITIYYEFCLHLMIDWIIAPLVPGTPCSRSGIPKKIVFGTPESPLSDSNR